MTEFTSVIRHINELFAVEHKLHNKFDMIDPEGNNVTFGFIPKLDDISMGEFIDLEKYIGRLATDAQSYGSIIQTN